MCSRCASMVVMWKNRYDVDEARWASFQLRSSRKENRTIMCAAHSVKYTQTIRHELKALSKEGERSKLTQGVYVL